MKKYGRIMLAVVIMAALMLTGCFTSEKVFSGSGMTITLTSDYVKGDVVSAQLYATNNKAIFMGNGESKDELSGMISSLQEYIDTVLSYSEKDAVATLNEEGAQAFYYAYYTSTVEGLEYKYMMFAMEGSSKYYTMNFGCLEVNFEKYQENFMKFAKTATVE